MPKSEPLDRRLVAMFGAAGALAPDIVWMYSKRFSETGLAISMPSYVGVTVGYLFLAAIVALIFPYPGKPALWKPFAVGVGLPTVISGAATAVRGYQLTLRGTESATTIFDLLGFF